MASASQTNGASHVGALDGLRGFAALWVFLSHAQILSGMRWTPVLSWGDLAVDLFMMISGFLMAHHYIGRQSAEPWGEPKTWLAFWLRRIFRIAPSYYVLLAVALVAGPWLGEWRTIIGNIYPDTVTAPERYTDASLRNVVAHITFAFGAMPTYAFRTPLPDWSIGLEMQFYLAMPLLMICIGHRFSATRAGLLVLVSLAIYQSCSSFFAGFEMPSHLIMKLPVFMIGMALAYGLREKRFLWPCIVTALVVAIVLVRRPSKEGVFFAAMVIAFITLISVPAGTSRFGRSLSSLRSALGGSVGRFLGDSAYSLYLAHLLVLLPLAGTLATQTWYVAMPGAARFATCVAIALPISLFVSRAIFAMIEQPGIAVGKRIVSQFTRKQTGAGSLPSG